MQVASAIRPFVPPPLARFLTTQPWVMVGAADPAGPVWATALCGPAGFIQAADGATILIDALRLAATRWSSSVARPGGTTGD